MTAVPKNFTKASSLREQVLYVLSVMQKGSASEIASEVIEMRGISSEEGIADITINIAEELEKMKTEGVVSEIKEHRQKKRYTLSEHKQ